MVTVWIKFSVNLSIFNKINKMFIRTVVSKIVLIKSNVCFTRAETPDLVIFLNRVGSLEMTAMNTMDSVAMTIRLS
jgi:hypothetical protein